MWNIFGTFWGIFFVATLYMQTGWGVGWGGHVSALLETLFDSQRPAGTRQGISC